MTLREAACYLPTSIRSDGDCEFFFFPLVTLETRDEGCPDANSNDGTPHLSPGSCRFVLLTSKGATVCFVCTGRGSSSASPRTPPPISRASSFGSTASQTATSPPHALSRGERPGRNDGFARGGHASLGVNSRSSMGGRRGLRLDGAGSEQGGTGATAEHDASQQVVYLRQSCRFNSDLVRASIARWVHHPSAADRTSVQFLVLRPF